MKIKPRTLFAFMFYATFCGLLIWGRPIPETLDRLVLMLMAFYFGQRAKGGKNV